MPPLRTILLDWLALPTATALSLLATRWGKDNLPHILALPIFVLIWRMAVLSSRRPKTPPDNPRLQRDIANWHALGIVACVFLMAFEAGTAILAESRIANLKPWCLFLACTYLPYLLLSAWSEHFLSRRRQTSFHHEDLSHPT